MFAKLGRIGIEALLRLGLILAAIGAIFTIDLPWLLLSGWILMLAIGMLHAAGVALPALGYWVVLVSILALRLAFGSTTQKEETK